MEGSVEEEWSAYANASTGRWKDCSLVVPPLPICAGVCDGNNRDSPPPFFRINRLMGSVSRPFPCAIAQFPRRHSQSRVSEQKQEGIVTVLA